MQKQIKSRIHSFTFHVAPTEPGIARGGYQCAMLICIRIYNFHEISLGRGSCLYNSNLKYILMEHSSKYPNYTLNFDFKDNLCLVQVLLSSTHINKIYFNLILKFWTLGQFEIEKKYFF